MQAAAGVPELVDEQAFDEAVDVFVVAGDEIGVRAAPRQHRVERLLDSPRLVCGEHAGLRDCARPRDAAGDVVFEQAAIDPERGAELEGLRVGRRVEAAGPEGAHDRDAFARAIGTGFSARRQLAIVQAPLNNCSRATPLTSCSIAST